MESTSGASTRRRPCVSRPAGPTRIGSIVPERASRAPATISSGPRSPPIASTATLITVETLRSVEAERLDLASPVALAVRADVVWARRAAAVRAGVDARRLDAVLGAALVAPGLGRLPFRDCHERPRSVADERGPAARSRSAARPGPAALRLARTL